ncbi:hypothetical protein NL526_30020, partial [Klebsiella pneumoniae]|nr:hypothetical protein [Klebsiella pneumoniae]
NVYSIRTSTNPATAAGATIKPTGKKFTLAVTQSHQAIKSEEAAKRGLVRTTTLDEYSRPDFKLHHSDHDGPLPSVIGFP